MKLAYSFSTKAEFQEQWPKSVEALQRLHENHIFLPDYRYELMYKALQRSKRSAMNEIEKTLSRFWEFDERFFGDLLGSPRKDYRWSVYSLIYLGHDEQIVSDLLAVFLPLLGPYAIRQFGEIFVNKVCSTFADDVGYLLREILEIEEAEAAAFFDWQGHLNSFPNKFRSELLAASGLSELACEDFPPADVMRGFCPGVEHDCLFTNYRRDLIRFYRDLD